MRSEAFSPISTLGLRIRPVEFVENPVGVGEAEAEAFGFDLKCPDTALTLLPDEAVRQNDLSYVRLTGHRVLEHVARGTPDALGCHRHRHARALEADRCLHQADYLVGRSQDSPGVTAELAGV